MNRSGPYFRDEMVEEYGDTMEDGNVKKAVRGKKLSGGGFKIYAEIYIFKSSRSYIYI